ncbi:hypothetical protein K466DRAFT_643672 [Polyporus arcularius HHB13444]|uniref:Uncharacterized protein n=1 Tax=Polyporus arcularius HHB13444 TaxID=1314778 RepID=A0A5C3PQ07_9APHY|nr:hypothetical protein K466DRAFT_643672 [Polyporus arcularius HHB13444]
MSDLDAPPSPPPPSYEFSQQEFDQKTSRVLEQSAAEPPQPRVDEDGFEVWDDALFEAALAGVHNLTLSPKAQGKSSQAHGHVHYAASGSGNSSVASSSGFPQEKAKQRQLPARAEAGGESSGSGSSIASSPPLLPSSQLVQSPPQVVQSLPQEAQSPPPGVQPLRFTKKSRPRKERPAWYAEAGLGGNSSSPPPSPLTSEASSSSGGRQMPLRRQLTVFNHTEREQTPPPEFSAIGPSLDGPAYEAPFMRYEGTPPPLPPAPEPPAFEPLPRPVLAAPACTTPQPRAPAAPVPRPASARPDPAHSQSLPQNPPAPTPRPHVIHHQTFPSLPPIPSAQYGSGVRASLFEPGEKHHRGPRLSFNPQMAYAKPIAPAMPAFAADEPQVSNPSAFYSHAVSAHYSFNVPARMRKPTQAEQPAFSHSQFAPQPMGMAAASNPNYGAPGAVASVASPRPSYGYGQADFQETAHNMGAAWGSNAQQGWPAGASSSSSVYRME